MFDDKISEASEAEALEAEALDAIGVESEVADLYRQTESAFPAEKTTQYEAAYLAAKEAKVGDVVTCICGKTFIKRSYQHAFCSNKGRGNCKDHYWNVTDAERYERAKRFS